VDLYQIHRWDDQTPIEETIEALHDIVKSGKARYIGASSCYAWQFCKAIQLSKQRGFTQFVSMQDHYNLIYREEEREMIPYCQSEGIGILPWSPLARGLLTGTRKKGENTSFEGESVRIKSDPGHENFYPKATRDNDFEIIDRVVAMAGQKNVSPSQLSLAWLLHKPQVVAPIIGATKMRHLEDAVAALNIKLSPEDMKYLEELYKPHKIAGHT